MNNWQENINFDQLSFCVSISQQSCLFYDRMKEMKKKILKKWILPEREKK